MTGRVYILEGPDGGGKSTLAGELRKHLVGRGRHAVILHHGPYLDDQRIGHHYFRSMAVALERGSDVIMDRSWLSEPIYARIYRGTESRVSAGELQMLERAALSCGAIVIHCDPGWDAVEASWKQRKGAEYVKSLDRLRAIHYQYAESASEEWSFGPLGFERWDYVADEGDPSSLFRELDEIAAVVPVVDAPLAGCWNTAKAVIIGDRPNHKTFTRPFFSFVQNGCSWWLADQLAAAKIKESELIWANAYDNEGAPYLGGLETSVQALVDRGLPVYALGENALVWVARWINGAEVRPHRHPMYWKRFRYRDPYPLVSDLASHVELGRRRTDNVSESSWPKI